MRLLDPYLGEFIHEGVASFLFLLLLVGRQIRVVLRHSDLRS